jgi:hypothetical protein
MLAARAARDPGGGPRQEGVMRRCFARAIVLGAVLLQATPAASSLYYGFQIGISNAPPPPVVREVREPYCVRATDAMVYVVEDDRFRVDGDAFRYGQYWFVFTGGYWYRARTFRGPYVAMDVRRVPRAVLCVPRSMWWHHLLGGPPGQLKKTRMAGGDGDDDAPRSEHGHGHGHGR